MNAMKPVNAALLVIVALAAGLYGCALTSKGTPLDVRTFTPEKVELHQATLPATPPVAKLRMGDLTSSANLRYAIVHRDSPVEVEPYQTLRWTENPEDYVRRSLSRALFQDRPLTEVVGGPAVTLDVEVIAFEEIRRGERHLGRVQLGYHLHDDRAVLASGVVTTEREAASPAIESVVSAIGDAMNDATSQVAQDVVARLRAP
jgi:cholesterol transport system auxiliary component